MLQRKEIPLKSFLEDWAEPLGERVLQLVKPLHDPLASDDCNQFESKIAQVPPNRKPFPAQKEVIKALAKAFYVYGKKSLVLVGEMGVGKTLISIITSTLSSAPERVLVCCPPHLCPKWASEILSTVPNAQVINLNVKDPISTLTKIAAAEKGNLPARPQYYIISREKAKLSYHWKEAYSHRRVENGQKNYVYLYCSECSFRITDTSKEGTAEYVIPLSHSDLHKHKHSCQGIVGYRIFKAENGVERVKYRKAPISYKLNEDGSERAEPIRCNSPLWTAIPKIRRMSPAEFIKRKMRNFFTLGIFDECHELESLNSLQGNTFGRLASSARRILALTGTLTNGYALSLFALLYRIEPRKLKEAGFEYGAETEWMSQYGVLETVRYIDAADFRSGRGKTNDKIVRRRPGISPVVLPKYLLDKCVFLRLADISEALPKYSEQVVSIRMADVQKKAYEDLERKFKDRVNASEGIPPMALLSKMLMSLLSYPDSAPLSGENVVVVSRDGDEEVEIAAPQLDSSLTYPKEQALIDIIREQKKKGRRVLVFCSFTDTRDILPRIQKKLEEAGFSVAVLRSTTVKPEHRIQWFEDREKENVDAVICNAELVKTGVDLYSFPTCIFYQTGYKLTTLRQAARRAYRINQTQEVEVLFFAYKKTLQEECLALMAKKMEAALIVEGELPDEGGLTSLCESSNTLLEDLARSLSTDIRSGSAEEAWKQFRRKETEVSSAIETIVAQENHSENVEAIAGPQTSIEQQIQQLQPAGAKMIRFHRSKLIEVSEIKIKDGELEEVPNDNNCTIVQFTLF